MPAERTRRQGNARKPINCDGRGEIRDLLVYLFTGVFITTWPWEEEEEEEEVNYLDLPLK